MSRLERMSLASSRQSDHYDDTTLKPYVTRPEAKINGTGDVYAAVSICLVGISSVERASFEASVKVGISFSLPIS